MTRPGRFALARPRPEAGGVNYDDGGAVHLTETTVQDAITELSVTRPPTHTSSSDPTTGDDSGDGHVIGCRWINTSTDEEFVALDVSVGAAVWESTTAGGGSLDVTDGTTTVSPTTTIDFDPAFFDVTDGTGGVAEVTLVGSGSTIEVEDEGSNEGTVDTLNFTGAGVSVTVTGSEAEIIIPGGGGGGGGSSQAWIGYNTIGGSWESPAINGKVYLKQVSLADDCLVTSIGAYLQHASGTAKGISAAIYTDDAGAPEAVIAHTSATTMPTMDFDGGGGARWLDVPIGKWLEAGTYWIAVRTTDTGGTVVMQIAYDGSGSDRTGGADTGGASWPDYANLSSTTTTSNEYSIRANTVTISSGVGTDDTIPSGGTLYDGTSTSGWSTFGSGGPDTFNADSTIPGAFYLADTSVGGGNIMGVRRAVGGSFPRTYTMRMRDGYQHADFHSAGLVLLASGGTTNVYKWGYIYSGTARIMTRESWSSPTSFSSNTNYNSNSVLPNQWWRIVVNSSTDVELWHSWSGYIYYRLAAAQNPGFTIAEFGFAISTGGATPMELAVDWIHES